jgi:hypothetical protein
MDEEQNTVISHDEVSTFLVLIKDKIWRFSFHKWFTTDNAGTDVGEGVEIAGYAGMI